MFVGYFHGIWQSFAVFARENPSLKQKVNHLQTGAMLDRQRVCVFFLDNLGNVIINGVYYEFKKHILAFAYIHASLATLYLVMSIWFLFAAGNGFGGKLGSIFWIPGTSSQTITITGGLLKNRGLGLPGTCFFGHLQGYHGFFQATKQDKEGISCDDFLQFCKEIGYEESVWEKKTVVWLCGARRYP